MEITIDMLFKGLTIAVIAASAVSFFLVPFVYKKQKLLCEQNKQQYLPLFTMLLIYVIPLILFSIKTPLPDNPLVGLTFDIAGWIRMIIGTSIALTNTAALITDVLVILKFRNK